MGVRLEYIFIYTFIFIYTGFKTSTLVDVGRVSPCIPTASLNEAAMRPRTPTGVGPTAPRRARSPDICPRSPKKGRCMSCLIYGNLRLKLELELCHVYTFEYIINVCVCIHVPTKYGSYGSIAKSRIYMYANLFCRKGDRLFWYALPHR